MKVGAVIIALVTLCGASAVAQTSADAAYDERLRSAMASAVAFQGPMEGAWTLSSGTRDLFLLQLADRNDVVEGAWRDPGRPGALEGSGFIEQVERSATTLTFRIGDRVVDLTADSDGRLAGRLTTPAGVDPVTLRRRAP